MWDTLYQYLLGEFVSWCRDGAVPRPWMLQLGVMNLCLSKLCSSMGLGQPRAEGSSGEPEPTVLAVPLEGRNMLPTPVPICPGLSPSPRCGFGGVD